MRKAYLSRRREGTCAACGRVRPMGGRGLCTSCYSRDWLARHAKPEPRRGPYTSLPAHERKAMRAVDRCLAWMET